MSSFTAEQIAELRAIFSGAPQQPAPQPVETPELTLKDVLFLLVRHTRLPDEATINRCYAAIEKALGESTTDESVSNE